MVPAPYLFRVAGRPVVLWEQGELTEAESLMQEALTMAASVWAAKLHPADVGLQDRRPIGLPEKVWKADQ